VRQYQYGPNAAYKLLGSLANGENRLYINAGSHVLTLGELANIVSKIFDVPLEVEAKLEDSTSPPVVLLDSTRIDLDSGYLKSKEKSFESYIKEMIDA